MAIGLKTHKMLWGRSGGRCAICKKSLFEEEGESDDPSVIGAECHIVAREKEGPRGDDALADEQRDHYANLIVLCLEHHKIIDDQPTKYTIQELHRIKQEHEAWWRDASGKFDKDKQQDEEVYAHIIETWARLSHLDNWEDFTFGFLSGDAPVLWKQYRDELDRLHDWLFTRIYPARYPALNDALKNYRLVLHDFRAVFAEHLDPASENGNLLQTKKFYKTEPYDAPLYDQLLAKFWEHVELLEDLILELTRAANYVCENVRGHLMRSYRMKEGLLVARTGISPDGNEHMLIPQYRNEERTSKPYPGIEQFSTSVRFRRDFCFGTG